MARGVPSDPAARERQRLRLEAWRRAKARRWLVDSFRRGLGLYPADIRELDRWEDDRPVIAPDFVELGMAGFGAERAAA